MIQRTTYIKQLLSWKDKKIIKVLSGMRRVGKSTILLLYKDALIKSGISEKQILYYNLEDLSYSYINDYKKLYDELSSKLINDKMNYIMIDEIQNIKNFEKAIDSLYIKDNVDIYITGSNAKFLSSEIATVLSGRYIEFNILPLSFREYVSDLLGENDFPTDIPMSIKGGFNKEELFKKYIDFGALPFVKTLGEDSDKIFKYLESVYNTVHSKDILSRVEIRNYDALSKIAQFMFDNISNYTSIKKISDSLNSLGTKISYTAVDSYAEALTDSFLFYKVNRYDVKGNKWLSTQFKYYTVDTGIRNYVLNSHGNDFGRILENIIYFELMRRGCKVSIGKINDYEIDFVASKNNMKAYYQVATSVVDPGVLEREIKPLKLIKDNYPKVVISMDYLPNMRNDGIKCINIFDFLLGNINSLYPPYDIEYYYGVGAPLYDGESVEDYIKNSRTDRF